jgi:hypothetical protein
VPARAKNGTNQHTRQGGPNGHQTLSTYGTSATYLASRIKRDAPEVAARIGEFGSMAEAARAAGIPVAKPERVTLGDPEKVAARIVVKGPEFTRAVTQAIAALEAVRDSGAE